MVIEMTEETGLSFEQVATAKWRKTTPDQLDEGKLGTYFSAKDVVVLRNRRLGRTRPHGRRARGHPRKKSGRLAGLSVFWWQAKIDRFRPLAFLCRYGSQDIYRLLGRDPGRRPLTPRERAVLQFCVLELVNAERNGGESSMLPGADPMSQVVGLGR